METEILRRPVSIRSLRDGRAYAVPGLSLVQSNLFLRVGRFDEIYIKTPSNRGLGDYRKFVKLAQPDPEDIRSIETDERFDQLDESLERVPDLKPTRTIDPETAHYLLIHRLQYDRLREQTCVGVPEARFGVLESKRLGLFRRRDPAMFQERIVGTTLWAMYDAAADRIEPRWRPSLPAISDQLSKLLDSGLVNHIDWNIQNFVFREEEARLYYVDLKPTLFVAKYSNQHNLKGIREEFIV